MQLSASQGRLNANAEAGFDGEPQIAVVALIFWRGHQARQ